MTLYIDRLNGVWSYKPAGWQPGQDRWMFIATTDHFDHRDFVLGTTEPDTSVKFLAPFKKLESGEEFQFSQPMQAGDAVDIDYAVVNDFTIESPAYRKAKHTIVGTYLYDIDDDVVVVNITLKVPRRSVEKFS